MIPRKPPPLPDADDLPEMEVDDMLGDVLGIDTDGEDRLSAESEVSESLEDMSVQSFEDSPRSEPLDFDDGQDMGRHAH